MGQSFSGTPQNVEPRISVENLSTPPTVIGESPTNGNYGRGRSTKQRLREVRNTLKNPNARWEKNRKRKGKGFSTGLKLRPAHSMETRSKTS